jgi:hypothetical protein
MTTLLKTLGDDWHNDHAYSKLIESVIPSTKFVKEIERALYRVYDDEHHDFKSATSYQKAITIYDAEIECDESRKKQLEEEMQKEDKHYMNLLEKFQAMELPESVKDELNEEEEEEEKEKEEENDVKVNQKKSKGQQACKRSLKAEEQRKIQQAKGIKSSMATSQQKLIDMRNEVDLLEKKLEYYRHYQYASSCYINGVRKATREYRETKDLHALIVNLEKTIDYSEMMMRRYVPNDPCCGGENMLCKMHLLPLYRVYNRSSGFYDLFNCPAHPMTL